MVKANSLLFTGKTIYFKKDNKASGKNKSATTTSSQRHDLTSIKIAHTNINGIRNKIDQVSAELSDYEIVCVSETKHLILLYLMIK